MEFLVLVNCVIVISAIVYITAAIFVIWLLHLVYTIIHETENDNHDTY